MLKDVEICIHVWFGPSPNDTVRATPSAQTATCAPDCTLRGPVQGFRPAQCRARRQLLGARAAPRPNGTVRAGPHAARSRARLPDRKAPCAPAGVRRPGRAPPKRHRARRTARCAVPCPAPGPHGARRQVFGAVRAGQVFGVFARGACKKRFTGCRHSWEAVRRGLTEQWMRALCTQ